jgi:hypothetical protein
MAYPIVKTWLRPIFGSKTTVSRKSYKTPTGFRTIGGGSGASSGYRNKPRSDLNSYPLTDLSITASQERIIDDPGMQGLKIYGGPSSGDEPPRGIVVSNEVHVGRTSRTMQYPQRVHDDSLA